MILTREAIDFSLFDASLAAADFAPRRHRRDVDFDIIRLLFATQAHIFR